MLRLVTLPLSHYCEKVRWALERQGLDYREEGHAPVLHAPHTLSITKLRSRQVPILIDGDAIVLGSTSCLRHLSDHHGASWLYASPGAAELEIELDTQLGPHSRRVFYLHSLADRKTALFLFTQRVPKHEAALVRMLFPLVRFVMRRSMDIRAKTAAASRDQAVRTFADIGERLKDGRPYLCGEVFSAADLSFAALSAPLLLPAEYGLTLPAKDSLPAALRDEIDYFRATAAGSFALRLFRQERKQLVPPRRG